MEGRSGLNQKIPQHVAIIMDGNGRWAESRGLPRTEGHRVGVDVLKSIVKTCVSKKVPILSVWAFGQDNWARPSTEVDFLMQLFLQSLDKEVDELHLNGVSLRFIGDRTQLSQSLKDAMELAESLTAKNPVLVLNVVINYGGKWDIIQATKTIAKKVSDGALQLDEINEQLFATCLSMHDLPDPDLFIRTSGEQRVSNFFLWQLAYTELYFSDVCWPDFTTEEFTKALNVFATRERRFGKTSKQLCEL